MPTIAVVVFAVLVFVYVMGSILIMASRYKRVRPGHVLVVRCQHTGDRVIRKGGCFVWPIMQDFVFVPMDILEIKLAAQSIKVCVKDDDSDVLQAVNRFDNLTISTISSKLTELLKNSQDEEIDAVLGEYGMKRVC